MQYELTRSETIPFLDQNNQIIQMKNFEISITVKTEQGDTLENCEQQLDILFENHRQIISKKIPLLETGKKQLNLLASKLKEKVSDQEFKSIIEQVKSII